MSYLHCGQLSQVLALQIKQRIGQSKQKERAVCWISKLLENMLRCAIRNMALLFWLHDWFWDFLRIGCFICFCSLLLRCVWFFFNTESYSWRRGESGVLAVWDESALIASCCSHLTSRSSQWRSYPSVCVVLCRMWGVLCFGCWLSCRLAAAALHAPFWNMQMIWCS